MCPPCPPCPPVQSEDQLYANHKNNFGDVRQKVRSTGGLSGDSAVTGHILPAPSIHSTLCRLHTVYCAPRQSRCLMINMLRVVPILHSSNSRGFNQKQILNIQYVQSIINMNIIIRQLCENPWALDASAEPWTTAELKPRQLLSEVSRRNPRLWGEVTRPLPRHGPTFSSCYQLKYWAPEIPKWLKEFHRIENKGHGGSLMSKHRLDLLFDTIKPILDVCIYSISHQINLMLSFSRI